MKGKSGVPAYLRAVTARNKILKYVHEGGGTEQHDQNLWGSCWS